MSTKTIGFPANPSVDDEHQGWVWDGDKWVSTAVDGGGSIQDGDTQGQITTWDGTEWTPDGAVVVSASGDVNMLGNRLLMYAGNNDTEVALSFKKKDATESIRIYSDESANLNFWDGVNGILRAKMDVSGNMTVGGDGYFSGTVNANKFVGDGSGLTGVGGGLPDGDFTHNGKITATDFIATSDERVKDNITTAPVGLIDSLKGREWEWKESGEKGSGVVAQELEQVLPHLVQTDDDGMKSVAYNGLVAYLIEEVKALRAEVEALK